MNRIATSILFFLFFLNLVAQEPPRTITGTVTDGSGPLGNVNVSVKNTERGVKTDGLGKYSIEAQEGEILVYSYVGKKTIQIVVEDVTAILNITLKDKVVELDEVVVSKRTVKSQKELFEEYNTNKNLIKTGFGILDKERSGYAIKIIDGDDLSPAGQDFVASLESWVPGIQVFRPGSFRPVPLPGGNQGNQPIELSDPNAGQQGGTTDLTIPVVYLPRQLRGTSNPVPAAFEVDGVVYRDAPVFIQKENIERIAIVESVSGLARYGSLGFGGMVIINTKTGNFSPTEPGTDRPYDHARLRNNFYEDGAVSNESPIPSYLKVLQDTAEKEEAKKAYAAQEGTYGHFPHYHLDAMGFFFEKYGDRAMFDRISKKTEQRFAMNPTILKALAFKHEAMGDFERAEELSKKVFILRPHYAQSYMDLANSYINSGKPQQAATLFARYFHLVEQGFFQPPKAFTDILEKDFESLLKSGTALELKHKKIVKTKEGDFKGTRLVFEWNDGEAEFELRFVNPDGRYYTWKHTLADDPERIAMEKNHGFSCGEHLIYEPAGTWQVNVKYSGNKSLTPSYLKVTTYFNFGTDSQRKEVKEFKLATKNVEQKLFQINNGSSLSVN